MQGSKGIKQGTNQIQQAAKQPSKGLIKEESNHAKKQASTQRRKQACKEARGLSNSASKHARKQGASEGPRD
eukprot:4245092-Prorocentrum_lima.AAC.1